MGKAGAIALIGACLLSFAPAPPAAPPINEPAADGQIVNPADVHMEAGPFSDPDGGDTHASSDWEIWKISPLEKVWAAPGATGLDAVHIHLADGSFIGSYAGRSELEYDVDYRLQVRFTDNNSQTSPFSLRTFRTSPAGPPGVAGPMPWLVFQPGFRIETVAGGFQLPVNIAFVPNPGPQPTDPFFYVTELYGTIKVVRRNGAVSTYAAGLLNYDPTVLGSFPGAGEQGLTGICVDPVSGDVFASCLQQITATERNPKVIRLHSTDGGLTGAGVNTLLMSGEPQGQSHQISNASIGPDGKLYVHSGDGFDWTTAGNLDSYRGKVLRMNLDFTAPSDNPHYNAGNGINARDYVFAYGLRNPFGGAWRAADGQHYEVENGPSVDRLARIPSGRNFAWSNTNASMANFAIYQWNPSRAPVNIVFVQPQTFVGSGFPAGKMGRAFVTESGPTYATGPQALGKRIVEFELATGDAAPISGPTKLVEYNGTGKSTAVALAAGPDGLYFSDLYKETGTDPAAAGANILRVRWIGIPPDGTGTGIQGEYFDDLNFAGTKLTRTDPLIGFNWGSAAPDASMGADTFSVRWMGRLEPRTTDTYTFYTQSNDGVRLWVNGTLVIDNWTDHASTENTGTIALVAGQVVDLVMEYYDNATAAVAQLSWSSPAQPKQIIPASQLYAPDLRDNDGDAIVNTLDLDDDNDTIADVSDPDRDGDGFTNAAEIAASTDPEDDTSFPAAPPPPPPPSPAEDKDDSRCGLLGAEVLLLLAVTFMRRRNVTFRRARCSAPRSARG